MDFIPSLVTLGRGIAEEEKDEETIKNDIIRKARGILNKLSPTNIDKSVTEFLDLNLEDKDRRIAAVVYVICEKAISEPFFSSYYAQLLKIICDRSQLTAKKFRKYILDECQMEFQKWSAADDEIKTLEQTFETVDEDKKTSLKLELVELKLTSKERSEGNIRFMGEMYNLQMLTPGIMIDIINIYFDAESYIDLCTLLTTIGRRLDLQLKELEARSDAANQKGQPLQFTLPKNFMNFTFEKMKNLSLDEKLTRRARFALEELVSVRESGWESRRATCMAAKCESSKPNITGADPRQIPEPTSGISQQVGIPPAESRIECRECKRSYKTQNGYNGHLPCPGPAGNGIVCQFCPKSFPSEKARYAHATAIHGPKGRDPKSEKITR